MSERAKIHVTDVVMAAVTTIAALGLAPTLYDLGGELSASAGPLGQMLVMLVVPVILLGLVVSAGVSARRRD